MSQHLIIEITDFLLKKENEMGRKKKIVRHRNMDFVPVWNQEKVQEAFDSIGMNIKDTERVLDVPIGYFAECKRGSRKMTRDFLTNLSKRTKTPIETFLKVPAQNEMEYQQMELGFGETTQCQYKYRNKITLAGMYSSHGLDLDNENWELVDQECDEIHESFMRIADELERLYRKLLEKKN